MDIKKIIEWVNKPILKKCIFNLLCILLVVIPLISVLPIERVDACCLIEKTMNKVADTTTRGIETVVNNVAQVFSGSHDTCKTIPLNSEGDNWLSKVDDNKKITEINIPGTHNAATQYCGSNYALKCLAVQPFASCQNDTINYQLKNGVRYIDLRVDGSGVLTHDKYQCFEDQYREKKLTFEKVLNWVTDFLKDNPSETVLLQVKSEGYKSDNVATEVNKLLIDSRYNDYYYKNTNEEIPKLKDVRGKFVVFSRVSGVEGAFSLSGWKSSDYAKVKKSSYNIFIQDQYDYISVNKKLNVINEFFKKIWQMQESNEIKDNDAIISFSSMSIIPKVSATMINGSLQRFVTNHKSKRLGIILMDAPGSSLIKAIYSSNY